MPNYKKKISEKINIKSSVSSSKLKSSFSMPNNKKIAAYLKRQAARKAQDKEASEKFSEYSNKNRKKTQIRDINDPKSLQEKGSDSVKKIVSYLKAHKKPRDERAVRHINPKHLLWVLVVICAALIILSGVSEQVRKPFKDVASVVIVPVQKGINSIGLWISDKLELQKSIEELEEENKLLKEQIEELSLDNTVLKQKEQELDRLQELLVMKDKYDYEMEAAHVIAKSSSKWYSTFTIDKGSADGIQKDMNVIASGGLVGIITDVGDNFSTVRSIIDDESSVSAQFQSNSELCILNGSLSQIEQNLIEFTDVSADVIVTMNDAVVTSHVSSKYVPGLLIGYVTDCHLDANDLTQTGHIKPIVDFASLQEVMVITQVKETGN